MAKKKQKTPQILVEEYAKMIEKSLTKWNHIHTYGGSDPCWSDDCGLNLTRNHIIYYKNQIKELCEENNLPYPKEYDMETPPKIEGYYMARADEIRENAKKTLAMLETDSNLRYLKEMADVLSEKTFKKYHTIIASVTLESGLRKAIDENDLVAMRRYENTKWQIDFLAENAERLKACLAEDNNQDKEQNYQKHKQLSFC